MNGLRTIGRRNFIGRFSCTDHFLEKAWFRKIDVDLIVPALQEFENSKSQTFCLLIPLDQRAKDGSNAILVKVKGGCLITLFFVQLEDYLGKNQRDCFELSTVKYKTK